MPKSILVVTAHVGDFVWRCGGAMALHADQGHAVHVVCLSFGENGESNSAWTSDTDVATVKQLRQNEAETAAKELGATSITFFDLGDYPLNITPETVKRLSSVMRDVKPAIIITHPEHDPSNLDHCKTFETVLTARMQAIAPGHGKDYIVPPQVLSFEPHQSELCLFKPNILLDISPAWEKKKKAMQSMLVQKNLWAYYERVALQRGAQAGRRGQSNSAYAEAYQAIFPLVVSQLVDPT